ncbi:MAG: NAD(P)-binding domain-containing protein [Firmicutes bacterium]|nr:NAD(P)-binding domain-containing protein [Bacillota bacterium]
MITRPRFAIIGAGNGGQSLAAHLTLLGFEVSLYDADKEKIDLLRELRTIKVYGAVQGGAAPACITSDIAEAVQGADILMVVVPTCFHADVARAVWPYLVGGQVIVLNPGATGGALEFRQVLRQHGCRAKVTLAETQTLIYACRSPRPGEATIFGIKNHVDVATLPAGEATRVTALLNTAFPQYRPAPNVLFTSLNNVNAMCHPAPTLFNAARIEGHCTFEYYFEGITPSVAKVVERIDAERLAIGEALGIKLTSVRDWYVVSYGVDAATIYEAIQNNKAYAGIKGPTTLNTRYIFEDVPTGLVPLALLGGALGLKTPATTAIVELANIVLGRNFWEEGRTLEKLGLAGKTPQEIQALVS